MRKARRIGCRFRRRVSNGTTSARCRRRHCSESDAIVHLAGEPVAEKRWTNEQKRLILDTRVLGTRRLVQAVLRPRPGHQVLRAWIRHRLLRRSWRCNAERGQREGHGLSRRCGRGVGGGASSADGRAAGCAHGNRKDGDRPRPARRRAGENVADVQGVRRRQARQRQAVDELDPHRRHRRAVPARAGFTGGGRPGRGRAATGHQS